jgi:outer membrane protein assembly factor BamD
MAASITGCAWWNKLWGKEEQTKETPEILYQKGNEAYQKGKYDKAIEAFQRVKEQYPLSELAIMAELGIADSHFSSEEYVEAELAYNEFLNMHPTNDNLPYVMYQLGLCHYNQISSIDRDQTETIKALKEFERLISRFPDSKLSFLAEKKIYECRKLLAEKEFYIGQFYFKQKLYKAALARFETIQKVYPGLGLDYKVAYVIQETKQRLSKEKAETKTP